MIKIKLRTPIDYIWSRDPALREWIAQDPSGHEKARAQFLEDLDADAYVASGPAGIKPARFRLKPLGRGVLIAIEQAFPSGIAQDSEVVAFSLLGVTGVEDHTGAPITIRHVEAGAALGNRVPGDQLDVFYDPGLFAELARAALRRSRLDP